MPIGGDENDCCGLRAGGRRGEYRRVGCTINAHDTGGNIVTVGSANTEGYQIMAEILVTVRKIVYRGLEKVAGKNWYQDALPPGLFERLVERKEKEASIDRFDRGYQELISFASLDDLAEMVEHNDELAQLLKRIEPDDVSMVDRLREIEALRLKLAATAPFDDDDLESLVEYHQDLKRALSRRKAQSEEPTPPPPEQEPFVPEPDEVEELTPEAIVAPEDPEAGPMEEREELLEEIFEDAGAEATGYETEMAKTAELAQQTVGGIDQYGTVAARLALPVDEPSGVTGDDVEQARRAIDDEQDREALRVLRREVMSVAELVLQNDPADEFPVWEAMGVSGWLDRKRDELGLEPVERFYTISQSVLDKRIEGHSADEIKAFLDESGFSGLLLELRDTFLRHEL